jgi:hypothetical protein
MEHLFTTELGKGNDRIVYDVIFENEKYSFIPKDGNKEKAFETHREHDEWHGLANIDEDLKAEAISSLEKYLLAQH